MLNSHNTTADQAPSLSSATLGSDDLKRQHRMVHLFTAVLVAYELLYGFYWLRHDNQSFGAILVSCGFLQLANWLSFLKHRRVNLAKPLITIASIVVLTALLVDGGIDRTGIYFMFIFPPLTYMFQGVRLGLAYNGMFLASLIAISVAKHKGLVELTYTQTELREMWSALLCLNLLGYAAESGWDRSRRLLNERTERFRTLVAELPIGVMMVEKDGSLSAINSEFNRLVGGAEPKGNIFTPTKFQILHEDGTPFAPDESPTRSVLATGKPARRKTVFLRRPDGSTAVLRISAAPIKDEAGKVIAAVSAYEDMTQDYAIDRAKSEFISVASHQLKAPLTSVKWAVETMLAGDAEPLGKKQRETVGEIGKITERLLRTIGDFLSVSRIENRATSSKHQSATDIIPVLKETVSDASDDGRARRVTVHLESALSSFQTDMVEADFREAISNLLSNAVKYSLDGGRVTVGFSKEISRIYDKFFRASNVSREIDGTGLGLYIVKSIVEGAGGSIRFSSEAGRGTEFVVELPESHRS
jgi:PAS domain S-box-containing protein